MTFLNPVTPPLVHIEVLPKDHDLVTAFVTKSIGGNPLAQLAITAYMPADFATCVWHERKRGRSSEDFFDIHCRGCEFNVSYDSINTRLCSRINQLLEEDDEPYEITQGHARSRCPFANGDGGIEDCIHGHEVDDSEGDHGTEIEYKQAATACRAFFNRTLGFISASIWLQRIAWIDEFNDYGSSAVYHAMNTWFDSPPRICWGENIVPQTLADTLRLYCASPSNNDLLEFGDYKDNVDEMINEDEEDFDRLPRGDALSPDEIYYVSEYDDLEPSADAVIIASIDASKTAFEQLALSGAHVLRSRPSDPFARFAVIAAWRHEHQLPDGSLVPGWLTAPVADGTRRWFITTNGQLIGQLSCNPSSLQDQCTSQTPSSSDVAALAAN